MPRRDHQMPPPPWRWAAAAAVVLALADPGVGAQAPTSPGGEELIERTVAVVGGRVVTQSEVDVAVALGLVTPALSGPSASAVGAVIDRQLLLLEVARFSPPDPAPAAVQERLAAVGARAGSAAQLAEVLARGGFTPARLASWVRDDLRIAAYLAQRFPLAGTPAEADVAAYVDAHRAEFARDGVAPGGMTALARTRLVAERRQALIGDWLEDLRRRTEVVEFTRTRG